MTESAALSLNLKLQVLEVRRREDVAGAVRAARDSQAGGSQRFLFAGSLVTPPRDHRFRGGIPSSGNLSVEGTLLRDIIPGLSRVTALWDPTTGASQAASSTARMILS